MRKPAIPPPDSDIGKTANPVLVWLSRGHLKESFARGAFAIANAAGGIVARAGNIERKIFPRSAIKLLQALPLVENGAADAFALGSKELALACASHSGEPAHVESVARWLTRIDAKETDLICGAPSAPLGPEAAEALLRAGRSPTRLHHNCSGKHAGFLTVARHVGAPLADYARLDHRVQRAVVAALSELCDTPRQEFVVGLDGCGAPNFALPLAALALGFARVANPSALAPARQACIERLLGAARDAPFFTAGTARLCTRIMAEAPDVYVKGGAEGVYVAALPRSGLGLALKMDDGGKLAAEAVLVALLVGLSALAPDSEIVRDTAIAPVRNSQGRIAAVREVPFDYLIEVLAEFSPQALAAAAGARPPQDEVGGELA